MLRWLSINRFAGSRRHPRSWDIQPSPIRGAARLGGMGPVLPYGIGPRRAFQGQLWSWESRQDRSWP